jgi:CBS domain-containing protein
MTRVVYSVQPGDPVMTVVRLMIEEDIHRAVVVEGDDTLVGIVTRLDILRALARGDGVQDGDYAVDMHHEVHSEPAVAVAMGDRSSAEFIL